MLANITLMKVPDLKHSDLKVEGLAVDAKTPLRGDAVGTIAVFGAGGFIGAELVKQLASRGAKVRAVARRFDEDEEPIEGVDQVRADLLDVLSVARALEGATTVVQLANNINPASGNHRMVNDLEQELVTQVRFLETCVLAGVKRVIFPSSGGAVYGQLKYSPADESHPTYPVSSYGMTKLAMERYLHLFYVSHGLEYIVTRISNPYGPKQQFRRGQGLIPLVIDRVKNNQPATVFGNGLATRDFVYIGDLVDGMISTIERPEIGNQTINLASGQAKSVMDVINTISSLIGRDVEIERVAARNTDVAQNCLDVGLAKELLDWTPKTSFHVGMRKTLEAHGLC